MPLLGPGGLNLAVCKELLGLPCSDAASESVHHYFLCKFGAWALHRIVSDCIGWKKAEQALVLLHWLFPLHWHKLSTLQHLHPCALSWLCFQPQSWEVWQLMPSCQTRSSVDLKLLVLFQPKPSACADVENHNKLSMLSSWPVDYLV